MHSLLSIAKASVNAGEAVRPVSAPLIELDVIRGLAALLVLVGHLRVLFFAPWPLVVHKSHAAGLVYFVTGFGHQAVMVFFVLSGYLVGGSVLRLVRAGTWSWAQYLSRRAARLYAVLVPALAIGAVLDLLGASLFARSGVYRGLPTDVNILPGGVLEHLTWQVWLGNLAFLQTIAVPTYGSNGALWSLSYEWWYYILFPLILVPGPRRMIRWGLAMVLGWCVGLSIVLYFGAWLLGVLVAVAPPRKAGPARWRMALAAAGLGLAICLVAAREAIWSQHVTDIGVAGSFAAFLWVLLLVRRESGTYRPRHALAAGWTTLAGFSYTLYATHLPVLVFLHAMAVEHGLAPLQPTAVGGLGGVALAGTVTVAAWALSQQTEAKTERLRQTVFAPLSHTVFREARSSSTS